MSGLDDRSAPVRISEFERQKMVDSARIAKLELQNRADSARIAELERQNVADSNRIAELEKEARELRTELAALRTPPRKLPQLDSKIVTEFPMRILEEFASNQFLLLWRGSRDGFLADNFHM